MSVKILIGDVRERLKDLADESVHCVVTSPPYWGLRCYGTATWEGGSSSCDHVSHEIRTGLGMATLGEKYRGGGHKASETKPIQFRKECGKCGAKSIDLQLGQESTYQEHVQVMADLFDEVKRVLRKDGTLWLNYGDSYASNGSSGLNEGFRDRDNYGHGGGQRPADIARVKEKKTVSPGLKPKDLCGIPWRVAFALQERGWYLRQDIIWAKPNPMPESVKDRCTKAHEYVFLLTKSERYYYDQEAIREEELNPGVSAKSIEYQQKKRSRTHGRGEEWGQEKGVHVNDSTGTWRGTGQYAWGRNKRSVWEIATSPFPEAHFATFPPELPEICIKAGTSEKGCCARCQKSWMRVTEETPEYVAVKAKLKDKLGPDFHMKRAGLDAVKGVATGGNPQTLPPKNITTGWRADCGCANGNNPFDTMPCTVLDPFGGAGTTGLVADRLQRNAILIELNPEYAAIAKRRIHGDQPLFAEVV